MNEADLVAWYADLIARAAMIPTFQQHDTLPVYRSARPATAWLAQAHAALVAAFPLGHPVRASWDGVFDRAKTYTYAGPSYDLSLASPMRKTTPLSEPYAEVHFAQALGVFESAYEILRAGRLRSLMDGVRAGTIAEVLDQADALLGLGYDVAAAVLAGGALETHLLHLCKRHSLTWLGDGSITKYDGAVAQARNAGTVEVYKATDTKLIGAWGGMRNDAAHGPANFRHSGEEVGRMAQGIREFIARVP